MAFSLGVNGGTRPSSACKRHIFQLVNHFHLLIHRMILVIIYFHHVYWSYNLRLLGDNASSVVH